MALMLAFGFFVAQPRAEAAELVHFESAVPPPSPFRLKIASEKGVEPEPAHGQPLSGWLYRPDGEGPFPAVVLLHGCGGIWQWDRVWAERLAGWGYVVLDVDSFGPRKKTQVCRFPLSVRPDHRARDAFGAKAHLAGLPFVQPDRIAVMGMSHGGWSVLRAVDDSPLAMEVADPFRAAVALYPWCDPLHRVNAPLLVLIGERDDWTPAARCEDHLPGAETAHELQFKLYPGAHHGFDHPGLDSQAFGHVQRYDSDAAEDAIERIRLFLSHHLH